MQVEEKVYRMCKNVPDPEMLKVAREYSNYLMLERLRPVDHVKIKGMISATLFNLRMYRGQIK